MRPRGLSFSSSRLMYVGHAWRQNPQWTHVSMPARTAASGVPGTAHSAAWDAALGAGTNGIVGSECEDTADDRRSAIRAVAEDAGIQDAERVVRSLDAL
jgi:hypothetical protein